MELRHVRYFLAVAEEENFTRAAIRVGIGQPPLSQQIRDLETELGTSLFRRVPKGAELTAAGKAFLPEARAILAQAERATCVAQRAANGDIGSLRVGFTGSTAFHPLVPAVISLFKQRYPGVGLSLDEAATTPLLEHLAAKRLDAAFIRPGQINPEGVTVYSLIDEPMVAVLPTTHTLATSASISLPALADEHFVLFPRSAGASLFDEIIIACRRAGFEPTVGQEAPQISSIVNMVASGLGVSLVPASIACIQVPGIVYLPITGDGPIARIALAIRTGETEATVSNFVSLTVAKQEASYE